MSFSKGLALAINSLKNKTVIVTGGSGTIGKSIAEEFFKSGSNVVIASRNLNRLNSARDEILQKSESNEQGSISCVKGDVTDEMSVKNLFDETDALYKGCDILINNAGIMAPAAEPDVLPATDFEQVMRVNVFGPFLCAKEMFSRIKKSNKEGGRIINIGSIAAQSSRPNTAPYTTSKFAINGLSQSLALDGRRHNIAVGIIHPGNVLSDILSPEEAEKRGRLEGFVDPLSIANSVLCMASLPYSENILEMTVIPTKQPLIGRG